MSFSSDAKTEICRTAIGKKCCALAECYGILLYCNTFSGREIKIITEKQRRCGENAETVPVRLRF